MLRGASWCMFTDRPTNHLSTYVAQNDTRKKSPSVQFCVFSLKPYLRTTQFSVLYYVYLTTIGLTPGGSSTVHNYTQTVHRIHRMEQQISVLNFLNMLHALSFFLFKMHLFHNATFFGSCIIRTLHTGCAKILMSNSGAKRLIESERTY
jgi:hypothetical protein